MTPPAPRGSTRDTDLTPGRADVEDALTWLHDSDRVIIAAGAGLSAAAGYDYTDETRFEELFPAMRRLGFTARYQLIGQPLPPHLFWGYWATHVADVRLSADTNPLYGQLRDLVGERPHAVMSSNVDAFFTRNGFDPAVTWTPQGDYALMQCITPCSRAVWDARPQLGRILRDYDPITGETSEAAVPQCPRCGESVHLNVYAGPWYIGDHFQPGLDAVNRFLRTTQENREQLTILEIGSGFNTPGVIRWPVEQVLRSLPTARLVRVNRDHPEVPSDLAARSASVAGDAAAFVSRAVANLEKPQESA